MRHASRIGPPSPTRCSGTPRATDWLETDGHRDVFTADCVFASPHSGDVHGVDAVVDWMNRGAGAVRGHPAPDRQHRDHVHRRDHRRRGQLRAGVAPVTAITSAPTWCCGASTTIAGSGSAASGGSGSAGCSKPASNRAARRRPEPEEGQAMKFGVVFPQTELSQRPRRAARRSPRGRAARLRLTAVLRPRRRRRARRPRADAVGAVHGARPVPRPVRRDGLRRRHHDADRARHRGAHPPAAPDGARRPAGRRRRPVLGRPAPARRRHGLELGRVRRARPGLRHPWRAG